MCIVYTKSHMECVLNTTHHLEYSPESISARQLCYKAEKNFFQKWKISSVKWKASFKEVEEQKPGALFVQIFCSFPLFLQSSVKVLQSFVYSGDADK